MQIPAVETAPYDVDGLELLILAALVAHRQPRAIFEIGTWRGRTTLVMGLNALNAKIVTMDLPADQQSDYVRGRVGECFNGTNLSIEQIAADSQSFNFSPYKKSQDFIFIDAGHSYENARSDSLAALSMVKPGGLIAWHDYGRFEGVTRAVDELGLSRAFWINHTTLAVANVGE